MEHLEDQQSIAEFGRTAFPNKDTSYDRIIAFIEEAIELCLAEGLPPDKIMQMTQAVISRSEKGPNTPGVVTFGDIDEIKGEVADVYITLAYYAQVHNIQLHECVDRKMMRNRKLAQSYYEQKRAQKEAMGLR